jgi:hypothetical protein
MKPAPQTASLLQVRRQAPVTQIEPAAQGVAQVPAEG